MNSKDILFQMRELASIVDSISKTVTLDEERHRQQLINFSLLESSYDLLVELYKKSLESELLMTRGIIDMYKKDKKGTNG